VEKCKGGFVEGGKRLMASFFQMRRGFPSRANRGNQRKENFYEAVKKKERVSGEVCG